MWLTLRTAGAEPTASVHPDRARLVPLAADDQSWLSAYHLFSDESIEFFADGSYRESPVLSWSGEGDADAWCMTGFAEHRSHWTRDGWTVRVAPGRRVAPRELQLGLLDGEFALLGEFNTWRRVPRR
jgi:hypothetical protein